MPDVRSANQRPHKKSKPAESQPKRPPRRARKTSAKQARRGRGKGGGTRTPAPRP